VTRLGVLGWPVAHSRSPAMQRAALQAVGLDGWSYQLLPVPPELFDETVRALPAAGFLGANVTIPHKEAALAVADSATPLARTIGAANTLTFTSGGIEADNTDAPGLLAAIGDPPASALVLGAGGSARAAIHALAGAGCEVSVLARTPSRADGLPATVVQRPVQAEALVNCTPVGLEDPDELPLDPAGYDLVVDLVYREGGTALTRAATGRVVDGLEILVRQGALSFAHWTGRQAPLDAMRAAVQFP
jgi:shikimate dehydrogenase